MINNTIDEANLLAISQYETEIAFTDVLNLGEVGPILMGLYGEVGGIMSTAKKHIREGAAYPGFKRAAEEEFGDTLWYLAALCRRSKVDLAQLFASTQTRFTSNRAVVERQQTDEGLAHTTSESVDSALFQLGLSAAELLRAKPDRKSLEAFAKDYLGAVKSAKLDLTEIASRNLHKTKGAFLEPAGSDLIDFDAQFEAEEQLPRKFEIRVNQRGGGKSYLQWKGVFIGDPLTDNIADPDGYRFHDVFHFTYGAILHWSPVVRSLIKHKRKSVAAYDEGEDSGRAIVVEEGLTAWIFARAKELNYFEGQNRVSLGILKTISEFVSGYEVSKCPLKLWEHAILEGYKVFRHIRAARGGWIVGNRSLRTVGFVNL